MDIRIKYWWLKKTELSDKYNDSAWLHVTKESQKAYHLDETLYGITQNNCWVPKSCVLETRGTIDIVSKKYPINERYLFGLESMRDYCWTIISCDEDDLELDECEELYELYDECCDLLSKSSSGMVDGPTLGRIKEITYLREQIRFDRYVASGMSYEEANKCFGYEY